MSERENEGNIQPDSQTDGGERVRVLHTDKHRQRDKGRKRYPVRQS